MWKTVVWTAVGAAAALTGAYARSEYEKSHFSVETYEIALSKYRGKEMTLVFLSDLHSNCFGTDNQELLEAIHQIEPDAVLAGGDMMITDRRASFVDTSIAEKLLLELAAHYPVYYGEGNHESRLREDTERYGTAYEGYRKRLQKAGVHFLCGKERAELGEGVCLASAYLPKKYYKKRGPRHLEPGYLQKELGSPSKDQVQILMAHNPLFYKDYRNWGADVALAGHFHGGTIRLPFLGGVMTPQFQFFFPFCGGCFEEQGKYLVVSRGLGTHSINIRFLNRPHLVALKLQKKE